MRKWITLKRKNHASMTTSHNMEVEYGGIWLQQLEACKQCSFSSKKNGDLHGDRWSKGSSILTIFFCRESIHHALKVWKTPGLDSEQHIQVLPWTKRGQRRESVKSIWHFYRKGWKRTYWQIQEQMEHNNHLHRPWGSQTFPTGVKDMRIWQYEIHWTAAIVRRGLRRETVGWMLHSHQKCSKLHVLNNWGGDWAAKKYWLTMRQSIMPSSCEKHAESQSAKYWRATIVKRG